MGFPGVGLPAPLHGEIPDRVARLRPIPGRVGRGHDQGEEDDRNNCIHVWVTCLVGELPITTSATASDPSPILQRCVPAPGRDCFAGSLRVTGRSAWIPWLPVGPGSCRPGYNGRLSNPVRARGARLRDATSRCRSVRDAMTTTTAVSPTPSAKVTPRLAQELAAIVGAENVLAPSRRDPGLRVRRLRDREERARRGRLPDLDRAGRRGRRSSATATTCRSCREGPGRAWPAGRWRSAAG